MLGLVFFLVHSTSGFTGHTVERLRILALAPHTIKWISSFITNREQAVEIDGKMSRFKKTGKRGVIQGGMSSGDLFILFLNDLPNQTTSKCQKTGKNKAFASQYIDDIDIVMSARPNETLQERIQKEYDNMEK